MTKRCTIVFAGRRDNYEAAKAFRDAGWSTTLVTDLAFPGWLARFPMPRGMKRAVTLRSAGLDGIRVVPPLLVAGETMVATALRRAAPPWRAERLGAEAAGVANRQGGLLISYSTYGYRAFSSVRPDVRRILFQMHPHADACVSTLEQISGLRRGADRSVEWEYRLSEESFQFFRDEWKGAEGIIAASSFTKRTLMHAGAAPDRVRVVPYGAATPALAEAMPDAAGPLRLLFVGSFVRRKGALDLASLAGRFDRDQVEVHACGRGLAEPEVQTAFERAGVVSHWNVSDTELNEWRGRCDLLVFPSYLEGFGHVILESMMVGLPVLATDRTCATDLVVPDRHGWVVPAGRLEELERRVRWCLENRAQLRAMRAAVRARGLEFTWDRFRRQLVAEVESLLAC